MAVRTRLVAILAVVAIVVAFGAASAFLDVSSLQDAALMESGDAVTAAASGLSSERGLSRFRTTDIAPR